MSANFWSRTLLVAVAVIFMAGGVGWALLLDQKIDAANQLLTAKKYLEAAKAYKEVIDTFQKALPSHPRAIEVFQSFGDALNAIGKTDPAKKAWERAAQLRKAAGKPAAPGSDSGSEATVGSGQAATGNAPSAGSGDKPAPGNSEGPVAPAITTDTNRYSLASLKTDAARDHYARARAYLDDNMGQYAGPEILKALDAEADNADLQSFAGLTLIDLGDKYYDRARTALEALAKTRGDKLTTDEKVALARSLTLTRKPDLKRAAELLQAILAKEPKHFLANLALGELEFLRGEWAKALAAFSLAASAQTTDPRPVWGKADALLELKRNDEALAMYRDAMSLEPKNPMAHVKLGRALLKLNRVIEASVQFDRAVLVDPNCVDAHLDLVALQLPRNHDMSARVHLETAAELDPGNPRVHLLTGMRHEMQAHIPQAIAAYSRAAAYGGQWGLEAKQRLANIYAGVGHTFPGNTFTNTTPSDRAVYQSYSNGLGAASLYSEILAVNPKHPDAATFNERINKFQAEQARENALMDEIRHNFGTKQR